MRSLERQRIGKKLPKPRKRFLLSSFKRQRIARKWPKPRKLSVMRKVKNWKENSKTINTFHDKVIPETENWEENVAIRKTFFLKESYMLTSEKNCVLLDLHCFIICSLRNSHQTSTDYNLDVSENYQYLLLCLT